MYYNLLCGTKFFSPTSSVLVMKVKMLSNLLILFVIAGIVDNEVVNDIHFTKCNEFFYKRTPPSGFLSFVTEEICQRYQDIFYYATLYSPISRIPIYSAYRLDTDSCTGDQPDRRNTWFVEPQLSGMGYPRNMRTAGPSTDTYKQVQAINADYRNTNFDRGHLNPNFYQCDAGRTATFTLTNAVPQDPCINQNMWKEMETVSKNIMTTLCSFPGAKRYFVTGAVPGNQKIPSRLQDEEGDEAREYNRVTVPSDMWTAACCDSTSAVNLADRNKGFSFGYYGKNEPDAWVTPAKVSTMEGVVARMYNLQILDIFLDDCFEDSFNSNNAMRKLRVPLNKRVSENVLDLSKSSESSVPPAKRLFMQKVDNVLDQNPAIVQRNWKFADGDLGLQSQRNQTQIIRYQLLQVGLTTVLTGPKLELNTKDKHAITGQGTDDKMIPSARKNDFSQERRREVNANSKNKLFFLKKRQNPRVNFLKMLFAKPGKIEQEGKKKILLSYATNSYDKVKVKAAELEDTLIDNYAVVPSSPDTWTSSGYRCRDGHSCGYHDKGYYWCYIDWSDNWDYCCVGDCHFGDESYQYCNAGSKWTYCSLPYSAVTISGKPCLQDHLCGMHGESYFWCYTDTNENYDYCCQPWHDCLYHEESSKWCYTGYKKKEKRKNCYY